MTPSGGLAQIIAPPARSIRELNAQEPGRASGCSLRVGGLFASFARQRYSREDVAALFAFARERDFRGALLRLMGGDEVNPTEGRAALHTALRGVPVATAESEDAHAQAIAVQESMRKLYGELAASDVTDIVSIGIGGSDLGPRLAVDALKDLGEGRFRVHFISNVDGAAAQRLLPTLDASRTAVLLISKTFTTQETMLNGELACAWLNAPERVFGITTNAEAANAKFGIAAERILPMWDWVGGRYSMWSAVGFPIMLAIGPDAFARLLEGAAAMDRHAVEAEGEANLVYWHALTALYNRAVLKLSSQAVLPYDERLKLFPAYLQQLVMESLGKSAQLDGTPVDVETVPVWWGGAGTDSQHSFFQALHQGTQVEAMDFIGVVTPDHNAAVNHQALLSNLLAQSEAFANGQASDDQHRNYAGNRPNTVLLLDRLTPETLGQLIALYEHSVYLQAVAWNINPFDQFGVELGKKLANQLLPALRGDAVSDDPVTSSLLAALRG